MTDEIRPFRISATDAELEDLRRRLQATRWPEREVVDDWSQGIPLAYVQEVCAYWAEKYDWRAREARLNGFDQFKTEIDGLDIHFVHVRSPHEDARPLVITHGWPGSIVEFTKVFGPLTDPAAHGGDPADAFHIVAPSLPGYGFSDKPTGTGWGIERIGRSFATLMGCGEAPGFRHPGCAVDWRTRRPSPQGRMAQLTGTARCTAISVATCLPRGRSSAVIVERPSLAALRPKGPDQGAWASNRATRQATRLSTP